jgi:simple sugar transport system permease protein
MMIPPDLLTAVFWVSVLGLTFKMAVPLIYGTIGEAFAERAGILNLGIEGMMLMGAAVAYVVAYHTNNVWLAFLISGIAGLLMGVLMAVLSVTLGVQQHVAGLAITILGSGLSFYIYRISVPTPGGVPPHINPFPAIYIPGISDNPYLGPIFSQPLPAYIAILAVIIAWFIFYKTNLGMQIRAVGENPKAADTAGINVFLIRYVSLMIAGFLIALGGSWLSTAHSSLFLPGMTQGRGWISIALVVFGMWDPKKILLGAFIFGGIDAFQLSLQAIGYFNIPYQLFFTLPYIMTIVALVIVSRRVVYPSALLIPYRREEA